MAALQRRGSEKNEKVGARNDVSQNHALEIAAGDAVVVKKDVEAVLGQVLEDGKRPGDVGPAVAQKYGLFDAIHVSKPAWENDNKIAAELMGAPFPLVRRVLLSSGFVSGGHVGLGNQLGDADAGQDEDGARDGTDAEAFTREHERGDPGKNWLHGQD